jgi:hypothetical protein
MTDVVFHFSEDPAIERFAPHVPATNPTKAAAVWAIDGAHAPLYWFPRDCPRVTAWPRALSERGGFAESFATTATRVHAVELGWLASMRTKALYRYTFDRSEFAPWSDAEGQWISSTIVTPLSVEPVGDLLDAHVEAGIELRAVPSLWPLHDLAQSDRWGFSMVRLSNARPRP